MSGPLLLLFDVDATLIRTHGAGMRAMEQAFQEVMGWGDFFKGYSPAGMTDPAIADGISEKRRGKIMEAAEKKRVFDRYLALLEVELRLSSEFEVLPGIVPFLETWTEDDRGVLGLGTGNLEAGAKLKLDRGNLNHFFEFGGYGSDASIRSQVLQISKERGEAYLGYPVDSQKVVVIGDTPHDINAGKAIGARTIAVETGPFDFTQLHAHQPDLVVKDFSEVEAIEHFLQTCSAG